MKVDLSKYSRTEVGAILRDLDELWETDTNEATLKLIHPIYEELMKIYHSEKDNPEEDNSEKQLNLITEDKEEKRINLTEDDHFINSRRLNGCQTLMKTANVPYGHYGKKDMTTVKDQKFPSQQKN